MDQTVSGNKNRWFLDLAVAGGLLVAVLSVLAIDKPKPPAVDLVFILDQRPEMRDLIKGMKANCIDKAEGLRTTVADSRFAVIPFGKKRSQIPTVPLTSDLADFKTQLSGVRKEGTSEPAESAVEALRQALALDFRKDVPVLFFLISKAPFGTSDDIASLARELDEKKITAIVQSEATEKPICRALVLNGRFYSMDGNDLTDAPAAGSTAQRGSRAANLLAQLAPDKASAQISGVKGIYSSRTDPNRKDIIVKLGGTPESEAAVKLGLEWLARHQADDGHWSDEHKCEERQPCHALKYRATHAETGLAVLAFQAGGHYYFNDNEYSDNVKRGLDWLVSQQKENGSLFGPIQSWYEHGMATFALAEACAVARANEIEPEQRYLHAAERAVQFIEDHQYAQGGWQYNLDSPWLGDASVSGWQVLALKSATEAKIDVSNRTMDRVREFYEKLGDPESGRTGYQHRGGGTDLTTAVGLIVQEFILKQPKSPLALKAVDLLGQRADQGIGQTGDFYTLYNCTLAMFLARGDAWNHWNSKVRDAIVSRQLKEGCARGSWFHNYRQTLDTAWAVLALEVYYRYAPEEE